MSRSHLMTNTPTYHSWQSMKKRCKNPTDKRYDQYGGRGITYSEKWEKFEGFLEDMGVKPQGRYSLDRIDVNLGYFKENCRWATDMEQANNKRNSRSLQYEGVVMTLEQWSRVVGIHSTVIARRIKRGWSVERSLTEKPICYRDYKGGSVKCVIKESIHLHGDVLSTY